MAYEQNLPKDPIILMSTINMKLRNQFSDLEKLCGFYQLEISELKTKMEAIGFAYDPAANQFK